MSLKCWLSAVGRSAADAVFSRAADRRGAGRRRRHREISSPWPCLYLSEGLERRLLLSAATHVAFAANPAGTTTGAALASIVVDVEDASNAIVSGDTSTVTLTLSTGVFSTGSNTATAAAVKGVATFSKLVINSAGSYTLTASDGLLTPAASGGFVVYFLNSTSSGLGYPDGAFPGSSLVANSSGDLFGRTQSGGAAGHGTVFEVAHGTSSLTTLVSLTSASWPSAGVTLDPNGDLFGTTFQGGAFQDGSVFEIAAGTNSITNVASNYNGAYLVAGVTLDPSGDIFGTTLAGGTSGYGTVFEIAHGTASITSLASFNGTNGADPEASLSIDSSGDLFGTTDRGGASDDGTVFELAKGANSITALASFNNTNGAYPEAAAVTFDTSGDMFGTTSQGGASGFGTVFELARGTNSITTLASFDGPNGYEPTAGVTFDSSGDLFGTTTSGGTASEGNVFEIARGTNSITTLVTFNGSNGVSPGDAVVFDAAGDLFGTTGLRTGTVFEIANGTTVVSTLASFASPEADSPSAGVTLDANGNLFGTTSSGGVTDSGTVFEIGKGTTTVTTLADFDNTDGADPYGGVTLDSSGDLFGTTEQGGPSNDGTVFEIGHGSALITTLASFNYNTNGANPEGGVIFDASGDLLGTAYYSGGASHAGAVFEIAHGTTSITTIAAFNNTNGQGPEAGVTLDSGGNLYGTTGGGGASNDGTVFEIARGSRSITTIAAFNGANGVRPAAGVTLDSSGDLFGTTYAGATTDEGTVFEIAHGTTSITTLASFQYTMLAGVILDPGGDLFGTGFPGHTTVFEIAQGTTSVTTLVSINSSNGNSSAGLTLDSSGDLFGTTPFGGSAGGGSVFELAVSEDLAFTQPPATTAADSPIDGSIGIQVAVGDSQGHPFVGNADTVTLTLSGGVFSTGTNTATATAVDGVATFTGLSINSPGTYTLTASDGSLTSVTSAPFTITAPPTIVGSPVINGDDPNGLFNAAGQPSAGAQRSMVEDVVYTFNQAVTIPDTNAAFTVVGTGANSGTAPTTLSAAAVPGSNGTQWAVTLTGQSPSVLGSIANGEYSITINPAAIFSAADGTTQLATGRTDQFYRLYGDINGDETVNAADNLQLKKALTIYNPAFDSNADGTVNAADNLLFKKDLAVAYFGDGFVTTI